MEAELGYEAEEATEGSQKGSDVVRAETAATVVDEEFK